MTTILVASLITTLSFGGLIALRYWSKRTGFAVAVSVIIGAECLGLSILFLALTWGRVDNTPWLDVPLRSLSRQAIGFGIAVAVLGIFFFLNTRILVVNHKALGAVFFGLLIPLSVGILMIGVRLAQDSPTPMAMTSFPPRPVVPTLQDVQTSNYTGLVSSFPSLTFRRPTNLVQPDDARGLLFVTEQAGRIHVFPNDQQVIHSNVFLDITDRVAESGEEGLLGLAFDPEYMLNGYFYVHYSAANPRRSVFARYSVSQADPTQADVGSEFIILEISQPGRTHNGGQLAFGPDGYLYLGLGNGGPIGDHPSGNSQDTGNLLGSISRIDVSDLSEEERYHIPPDNPFIGDPSVKDEIWAYGLRNPWRFSFDLETDRLWAGDVGQISWEEIDLINKGLNYGWKFMEGAHCVTRTTGCDEPGLQLPVSEYGRDQGCAVVGGYVYRGSEIPSLVGGYVYGDFCSGKIWALWYDGQSITRHELLFDSDLFIASFGRDQDGELYIVVSAIVDYSFDIYRLAAKQ